MRINRRGFFGVAAGALTAVPIMATVKRGPTVFRDLEMCMWMIVDREENVIHHITDEGLAGSVDELANRYRKTIEDAKRDGTVRFANWKALHAI